MNDDPLKLWRVFRGIARRYKFREQDCEDIASESFLICLQRKESHERLIPRFVVIDAIRRIFHGQSRDHNILKRELLYAKPETLRGDGSNIQPAE